MAHQLKALPSRFGRLRETRETSRQPAEFSMTLGRGLWSPFETPGVDASSPSGQDLDLLARGEGLRPLVAEAIAHQMRATLGLISGYSQTVLHLPLDAEMRSRYLARIAIASDSLAGLTDEMLEIASSPARASIPSPAPLPLGGLFSRIARELGGAIDAPIRVDVPQDLPLVNADEIWIALVVRNLVTNAAKYARGTAIVLSACARDGVVVASVSDGGGGIDTEERQRVFEPAFRGRAAAETGSPGSGLGLYLCRQLVAAHGGRIWLEEAARGGAVVSFTLPVDRIVEPQSRRLHVPVFLGGSAVAAGGGSGVKQSHRA